MAVKIQGYTNYQLNFLGETNCDNTCIYHNKVLC